MFLFLFLFSQLLSQASYAGNLEISPIRLSLDSKNQTTGITLRNTGSSPMVIQSELMKWTKPEVYTPTRELLVNPLIFTIKAGESQVVRVGFNKLPSGFEEERAYRLFFQEVQVAAKPEFSGLQIALRVGVPVFIPPLKPTSELTWRAVQTKSGDLRIELANPGNMHVQVLDLDLSAASALPSAKEAPKLVSKNVGAYLLPGQTEQWTFPLKLKDE